MDVSDLRKRIMRALDDARKEAQVERASRDTARREFQTFLSDVAVPLLRQAQTVLRAQGYQFSIETPPDSARLTADSAQQTFLELVLDVEHARPRVLGRISVTRGRDGVVEERPVSDRPIAQIGEEDLAAFLVSAIPTLVLKRA
jgi:hypothetical protein